MKYFFTGHISLDNRGSEAILRGLTDLIKKFDSAPLFIIPSLKPAVDSSVWGDDPKVTFVKAGIPFLTRIWSQFTKFRYFQRLIISLSPPLPKYYKDLIDEADVVMSIGGDMYTDEGKFPLWIYQTDRYALRQRKPIYLVGATVSDFKIRSHKELLIDHFSQFNNLLVREDDSYKRLNEDFGVENVMKTSDSAFWMEPIEVDKYRQFFKERDASREVVGLNISPLLEKLGDTKGVKDALVSLAKNNPTVDFILIPHVFVPQNNDLEYLQQLKIEQLNLVDNIYIVECVLNAPELKFIISKLDFLIAARTHATIAAFSSGVPTICLAYSDKAFGLARRIYASDKFVLTFNELDSVSLSRAFNELRQQGSNLRICIADSVENERILSFNVFTKVFSELK